MSSKLEEYVSKQLYTRFGHLSIRQNYWPDWLVSSAGNRMELDFFVPEMNLAAEIQGAQHYLYVPHFHRTIEGFRAQIKRDEEKMVLCRLNGVSLREIFTETDADIFIAEVGQFKEIHPKAKDLFITDVPDYNEGRNIKLALRALRKNDGTRNDIMHIQKLIVKVMQTGRLTDKALLTFYNCYKDEIDVRINAKQKDRQCEE